MANEILDLPRTKEIPPERKGIVWLNRKAHIKYSGTDKATHWGISGISGKGKTYSAIIISCQYDNVWFFDPKGGVDKVVREQGGKVGSGKEWEYWYFGRRKGVTKEKRMLINASEIDTRCINTLIEGELIGKQQKISMLISKWDALPIEKKTYEELKELFKENKLEYMFEDISQILDDSDQAPSIELYTMGRKIIDIIGIPKNSKALGLLVSIMFWKRSPTDLEMLVAFDEANSYFGKKNTPVAKVLTDIYTQGRSYKIHGLWMAQNFGALAKDVKLNTTINILMDNQVTDRFCLQFDVPKEYLDDVFDVVIPDSMLGGAFFHAPLFKTMGDPMFKIIQMSNYYRELIESVEVVVGLKDFLPTPYL